MYDQEVSMTEKDFYGKPHCCPLHFFLKDLGRELSTGLDSLAPQKPSNQPLIFTLAPVRNWLILEMLPLIRSGKTAIFVKKP